MRRVIINQVMSSDEVSTDLVKEVEITGSHDIKIPESVYKAIFPENPGPTHAMWYKHQTGSTEYLYITDVMSTSDDSTYIKTTQVRDKDDNARSRVTIPKAARDCKDLRAGQSVYFFIRDGEAEAENPSATLLTKQQVNSFLDLGINESSESAFALRHISAYDDPSDY